MFASQLLGDLGNKVKTALSEGKNAIDEGLRNQAIFRDIEKNTKAMMSAALAKLDLVTREEFEVQQAVLAKSRVLLSALEARVAALEAVIAAKKT